MNGLLAEQIPRLIQYAIFAALALIEYYLAKKVWEVICLNQAAEVASFFVPTLEGLY